LSSPLDNVLIVECESVEMNAEVATLTHTFTTVLTWFRLLRGPCYSLLYLWFLCRGEHLTSNLLDGFNLSIFRAVTLPSLHFTLLALELAALPTT
jgi:hypothetical protein